jgi:hypothetical protein
LCHVHVIECDLCLIFFPCCCFCRQQKAEGRWRNWRKEWKDDIKLMLNGSAEAWDWRHKTKNQQNNIEMTSKPSHISLFPSLFICLETSNNSFYVVCYEKQNMHIQYIYNKMQSWDFLYRNEINYLLSSFLRQCKFSFHMEIVTIALYVTHNVDLNCETFHSLFYFILAHTLHVFLEIDRLRFL